MYQHILVPLDGSELAECVLPHVKTIAEGCNVIQVTIVRVSEPLHIRGGIEVRIPPEERQRLEEHSTDNAREYLDRIVKSLKDEGIAAQSEVLHGNVEPGAQFGGFKDSPQTLVSCWRQIFTSFIQEVGIGKVSPTPNPAPQLI